MTNLDNIDNTGCVALELLPYKITVNAYCPGVILTDMSEFK